jgi:hypothetical protein
MGLFGPSPVVPVATTAALVAGKVLASGAGIHRSTTVQIDASASTAVYYIHMVQGSGSSVPANGAYAAPASLLHMPIAVSHTSGTPDTLTIDDGPGGAPFVGGLCVILSTTQFTKTGAMYLLADGVVE